jgi:MoaA/NifB/PqqE/SkfB family radical SAM enzyme
VPPCAGGAPDALHKVYVEPTNACNLDCRICVRHSWDEPEGFMEWSVYERIVEGLGNQRPSRSWASVSRSCTRAWSTW